MYEEIYRSDTYAYGKGSTVARIVEGVYSHPKLTGVAGVANVGNDRNWNGSIFNQANWYAYGRFAWDPVFAAFLNTPSWAVLGILGIVFIILGRKRRPLIGYAR